jgi:large subunit ribosomal protein L15e
MGLYKYLQKTLESEDSKTLMKKRLIEWRLSDAVVRIDYPTKINRARALGYKAKQGIVVARVKLVRGGRQRAAIKKGRKSGKRRHLKILAKSYQVVAEERAARAFENLEVLNSYYVAKDGIYYWFEVILVDPVLLKTDKELSWMLTPANRGRAYRGLTSAARKSRGLLNKGLGAEKLRPSLRAHKRLGTN